MKFKPTANIKWFALTYPDEYNCHNALTVKGEYATSTRYVVEDQCALKQLWVSEDGTEEWRNIEIENKRN